VDTFQIQRDWVTPASSVHTIVIVWLWPATKGPRSHSATPPPRWGVEENRKKNRQKLVSRDKGSLTEQQTKGTVTGAIQIRRIHNTKQQNAESRSHCPPPPHAPEPWLSSCCQLPPTRTRHDGTRYGIPCSVWPGWVSPPGCVPSWLLVKTNRVLAEPRTTINGNLDLCFSKVKCYFP